MLKKLNSHLHFWKPSSLALPSVWQGKARETTKGDKQKNKGEQNGSIL